MPPARVVAVETLQDPNLYSPAQIREAYRIAHLLTTILGRGKLIYLLPPRGPDAAR